jgi:hypothetical protein
MASAWTENGPVALPPKPLALAVGAALFLLACVGVGMGLHAAWKDNGAPELGGAAAASAGDADTLIAKPIVELPAAPPANATNEVVAEKDAANADAIDEKTAAAQKIQATPSQSGGDIDQILTSPTEKPPPAAKPAAVETPPGPPVKSDVPF